MGYKVHVTPSAEQDLQEIIDHLVKALENPIAASAFLDAVDDCYDQFSVMPLMYERCRDRRLSDLGYRRAIIKRHVLIYRVDEKTATVHVLRFFYGARDYEKLL